MNSTTNMIKKVQQQQNYNNEPNDCILRNHLYRLIMPPSSSNKASSIDTKNDSGDRKNDNSDDKNDSDNNSMKKKNLKKNREAEQWIETSKLYPNLVERVVTITSKENNNNIRNERNDNEYDNNNDNNKSKQSNENGQLLFRLSNGCSVVHVPTYLRGLWNVCQKEADKHRASSSQSSSVSISWFIRNNTLQQSQPKMETKAPMQSPSCNTDNDNNDWNKLLQKYDVVILAAGAGIFKGGGWDMNNDNGMIALHDPSKHQEGLKDQGQTKISNDDNNHHLNHLPITLVNGRSVEIIRKSGLESGQTQRDNSNNDDNDDDNDDENNLLLENEAVLCGKYVVPLPNNKNTNDTSRSEGDGSDGGMLIGSTREFKPIDQKDLSNVEINTIHQLKNDTYHLAPRLWDKVLFDNNANNDNDNDNDVENNNNSDIKYYEIGRVTSGIRVQSKRGSDGRLPIIGKWHWNNDPQQPQVQQQQTQRQKQQQEINSVNEERITHPITHPNTWVFTGLGSRGLIHHGIYGDILTDAIMYEYFHSNDGDSTRFGVPNDNVDIGVEDLEIGNNEVGNSNGNSNGEERMFQSYPHLAWWKTVPMTTVKSGKSRRNRNRRKEKKEKNMDLKRKRKNEKISHNLSQEN